MARHLRAIQPLHTRLRLEQPPELVLERSRLGLSEGLLHLLDRLHHLALDMGQLVEKLHPLQPLQGVSPRVGLGPQPSQRHGRRLPLLARLAFVRWVPRLAWLLQPDVAESKAPRRDHSRYGNP